MVTVRKYGYIKGKPDPSDLKIKITDEHVNAFAKKMKLDLKDVNSPIFDLRNFVTVPQALCNIDQGALGSCTANAIGFNLAFIELKQDNKEVFMPARLFIYYNERMIEGTVDTDSGATIKDGITSINQYGVCDEHHWIYDPSQFTVKPPDNIYAEALYAKTLQFSTIDFSADNTTSDRVTHLKKAIQSGFPFVFGITVYSSFEAEDVAKTGIVPMPQPDEQVLGGHALCCIGYDDTKQAFIIKNSWGAKWGLNSFCYIPYNYLGDSNLAQDFWIIQKIDNPTNIPNFSPDDINPDAQNLQSNPDSNGGVVNNSARVAGKAKAANEAHKKKHHHKHKTNKTSKPENNSGSCVTI